jgi:CBS domain containing-hemolysin-like protein
MFREYASLGFLPLQTTSGVRIAAVPAPRVTLDSPAVQVMTDFALTPAATIEPGATVDDADAYMRRRNVRSLIVTEPGGDVLGILTATDVQGEKPVKFALDVGVKHSEILVSNIMTPRALLELLSMDEVRESRVGHIVATLRRAGRQHFLVRDRNEDGVRVRGIFSLAQIARQLGAQLDTQTMGYGFAHTFAEIESALSH